MMMMMVTKLKGKDLLKEALVKVAESLSQHGENMLYITYRDKCNKVMNSDDGVKTLITIQSDVYLML
jgi:hypothetical protein